MRVVRFALYQVLGWLFLLPLAMIIPKKKRLVVFLGQRDGLFADNVKYLYLYLRERESSSVEYYFVGNSRKHPDSFARLVKSGCPVIAKNSIRGLWTLLRSRVACVDNTDWVKGITMFALARAKKVQLWHGSGIKKLDQLDDTAEHIGLLRNAYYALRRYLVTYDLVIMNSKAQLENRRTAFLAKEFFVSTHPRVDCLFTVPDENMMIGADNEALDSVIALKEAGRKVVLYAPTFRNIISPAEEAINGEAIAKFVEESQIVWVQKSHSKTKSKFPPSSTTFVIEYNKEKDVYPLLPYVDLLVTDYSSIYTDYILLDRPVLFFTYDLEEYRVKERGVQFNFDSLTPGPKVDSLEELLSTIAVLLGQDGGNDSFAHERRRVAELQFSDYNGSNAERVWNRIFQQFL